MDGKLPSHYTFLDILRHSSVYWGLTAPTFAWCVALALTVFTLVELLRLLRRVATIRREMGNAAKSVRRLQAEDPTPPGHGLSAATYDKLGQVFEKKMLSMLRGVNSNLR